MQAGFTMGQDVNLFSFVRLMQERGHKSAGSIRASIGLVTNFADVWRFLRFIAGVPRSRRGWRSETLPSTSSPAGSFVTEAKL